MSNARRRALRSTVRAMGWFAAAVSALRAVPCGTYRVDILRARRVLPVVADLREMRRIRARPISKLDSLKRRPDEGKEPCSYRWPG
jgi:hypothetical protein